MWKYYVTTAAANALHEETDALSSLIAQFKVGDTETAAQRVPPRTAPVKISSSPPNRSRDVAGRPNRSALAIAKSPAPAEEAGWEEF